MITGHPRQLLQIIQNKSFAKNNRKVSCINVKHIQAPRYIHHTILNIFSKATFWTFDTVLSAPLSYRYYLTSRVTLRCL